MNKKLILSQSGRCDIVSFWKEARSAYISKWSAGQEVWLTAEEAKQENLRQPTHLTKNLNGELIISPTFSKFCDPVGKGVEKKDWTCSVEGIAEFKNMDHVRWFFIEYMRDPIVEEILVD